MRRHVSGSAGAWSRVTAPQPTRQRACDPLARARCSPPMKLDLRMLAALILPLSVACGGANDTLPPPPPPPPPPPAVEVVQQPEAGTPAPPPAPPPPPVALLP